VNIREDRNTGTNFVQEKGVTYSTVLDSTGEVASQYGVRGIPDIFVVDKDGIIRFHGHELPSADEVEKVL